MRRQPGTPVLALLVACSFSVGRMMLTCLVLTLTGFTLIGVSVVVSYAIKRWESRHWTVETNLNGPMPTYSGVYGHFPVRRRINSPSPLKQCAVSDIFSLYRQRPSQVPGIPFSGYRPYCNPKCFFFIFLKTKSFRSSYTIPSIIVACEACITEKHHTSRTEPAYGKLNILD